MMFNIPAKSCLPDDVDLRVQLRKYSFKYPLIVVPNGCGLGCDDGGAIARRRSWGHP